MPSVAREACEAGAPAGRGGKCTVFAEKPGTFPGGGNAKYSERGLWSRCTSRPRGKVYRFRRNSRHFPRGVETAGSYDRLIRYCITCEIQETVTDVAEPG